jgi:hypothetical protein
VDLPKGKIQTTNAMINALKSIEDAASLLKNADFPANLRIFPDFEKYEQKEKEIPFLIYDVLKKESDSFTKLVRRNYFEEDAWLVSVECRECESLEDKGHEVYSCLKSGRMVDFLTEESGVVHFVKIRAPKVFVKTLSMPMIARSH